MARTGHTDAERRQVIRGVLAGMARGDDPAQLAATAAEVHRSHDTFPGEVFLELAAEVLDAGSFDRSAAIGRKALLATFLPEVEVRGRTQHLKMDYALNAPAGWRGGLAPDLVDEAAWWRNDDYWLYALYALIAYTRAVADRLGQPIDELCRMIGDAHDIERS